MNAAARAVPVERALLVIVPYLIVGLALSLPLLLVPRTSPPLATFTVHLALLMALGLLAALALASLAGADWFLWKEWSPFARLVASGASIVALVTGMAALVTLASSAALRYPPSLQFLQLLSALDIAWVTAAVVIGARRWWGTTAAVVGGAVVAVFCVWSIWNYLRIVGFGGDGGWLVDGGELMRLVIPFDMAAAVAALVIFLGGSRAAAGRYATEHASRQS